MVSAFEQDTPPVQMDVENKHFKAMGVTPDVVQASSEVIPTFSESGLEGDTLLHDHDERRVAAEDPAADQRANSMSPQDDASRALQRLHSICRPRHGGIITHTYSPSTLISALQLNRHLKPDTSISTVLAKAAPFFFGNDAVSHIVQELNSRSVTLPSEKLLRDARLRLDLLAARYEQERSPNFRTWRYLNPDSSKQIGWDWLIVREDKFEFSKDKYPTIECENDADMNEAYSSRTCKVSTLSRGHGGTVKKAYNISTGMKIESKR